MMPRLAILLLACGAVPAHAQTRIALPTSAVAGYAATVRGEELVYHSPMPWVDRSLLVRSLDRRMDIVWETAPVPPDLRGDTVVFAFALGIDVTDTTRQFDLFVNGDSVLSFGSPPRARLGLHEWRGLGGVRIEFHATIVDKYGDLMGYAFLHVPRARVVPGAALRLRVAGESQGLRTWFMVFKEPLRNQVILRNAPALLRSPSGNRQIVRVDVLALDEQARFQMRGPIGEIDTVVPRGHTRVQMPVPAVTADTVIRLTVGLGAPAVETDFTLATVTPLEVHLIHHTHLDIGYTEHQDSVERRHWSHLREALRLGRLTADRPEAERFVWHPEGLWAVESYLRTNPGDTTAFVEGVRAGWLSLDAMFANLLTGMASTEGLAHALDAKTRLERVTGVPIVSAMQSDIPGATWGLVPLFASHGVRYFSIGPNQGHRIGHFTDALGDRPFWWISDEGTDSVLTWVHGAGYSLFHTGLGYTQLRKPLDDENIFRYLDALAETDYPYDLTVLRYNIGSDNGPPDPELPASVRAWNERYASPRIVISSVPRAFGALEAKYGAVLPRLRGDLTGHWEDGVQSTARETAEVRRVAESLQQTEDLAARWGVTLPTDTLAAAWRFVLLYYEHTWGAWNSIGEPEAAPVQAQWARKRSFADSAVQLAERLRRRTLDARGRRLSAGVIEVWNSTAVARSDLVTLAAGTSVVTDRGEVVPSQVLRDGRLAFVARDVPAGGYLAYRVRNEDGGGPPTGGPTSDAIENDRFRVRVDGPRGVIVSLVDKTSGRELVQQGNDGGLAEYVYVPGRDPATMVKAKAAKVRVGEFGPIVRSLVWQAAAPGTNGIETEVVLVEGLPRIEVVARLDKRLVYDPEAVLYRFAFAGDPASVRASIPGGAFALEREQLPGANRNYFNARSWIDLRGGADGLGNVTLVTLDVPMFQVGELGSDPIVTGWRARAEVSGTVWSYVMNNYWETNYRAGQDGAVVVRYLIAPDADPERSAMAAARPLIAVSPP